MTPDLTCPHCQHRFPLTFKRYFGSRMGRHECPACGVLSRIPVTPRYFGLLLLNLTVVVVLPLIWWTGWPDVASRTEFFLTFLALLPFGLEVDRQMDGRLRGLAPIPGEGLPASAPDDEGPVKPLDYANPYEAIVPDED